MRKSTASGTAVAGVVPAGTVAVRVRLSGGAAPTVATTPTLPGYAGRYAGTVRLYAGEAELPPPTP